MRKRAPLTLGVLTGDARNRLKEVKGKKGLRACSATSNKRSLLCGWQTDSKEFWKGKLQNILKKIIYLKVSSHLCICILKYLWEIFYF